MSLKFSVGTEVLKKNSCASMAAPPRRGVVVGTTQKKNKRGSLMSYYLVKLDGSERTEEWAPGITVAASDKTASTVAFAF
jgi:hypothetical protein